MYDVIADYRHGHPRILPEQFSDLIVERGGFGAGTIIRFRMRVAGRTKVLRAAITEPDPGRVLVETNLEGKLAITTFTVTPADAGQRSDVKIETDLPVRTGLLGAIERFVTTRALQPLYQGRAEAAGRLRVVSGAMASRLLFCWTASLGRHSGGPANNPPHEREAYVASRLAMY